MERRTLDKMLRQIKREAEGLMSEDKLEKLMSDDYYFIGNEKFYSLGYTLKTNYSLNSIKTVGDLVSTLQCDAEEIDEPEMAEEFEWILGDLKRHTKNKDKGVLKEFWKLDPELRCSLFKRGGVLLSDIEELYEIYDDEYMSDLIKEYRNGNPTASVFIEYTFDYNKDNIVETLSDTKDRLLRNRKSEWHVYFSYFPAKTNIAKRNEDIKNKFVSITGEYNSVDNYDNFYEVIDKNKAPALREKVKKWLKDNKEEMLYFLIGFNDGFLLMDEDDLSDIWLQLYYESDGLLYEDKLDSLMSDWYYILEHKKRFSLGYTFRKTYMKEYLPGNSIDTVGELVKHLKNMSDKIDYLKMENGEEPDQQHSLSERFSNIIDHIKENTDKKNRGELKAFWDLNPNVRSKIFKSNTLDFEDIEDMYKIYDDEWLNDLFENYVYLLWRHQPIAYHIMQNINHYKKDKLISTLSDVKYTILNKKEDWGHFIDLFPCKFNYPYDAESEDKFISISGKNDTFKDYDNFYKVIDKNKDPELRNELKKWLEENRDDLYEILEKHNTYWLN